MTTLPRFEFEYRSLGVFTYHILTDPVEIKSLLMHWIMREWKVDHEQGSDESWTVEWMNLLPRMEFSLQTVEVAAIQPRVELMSHETDDGSFIDELNQRADEREEGMLRGVSIEPLLLNANGLELMDGYTRYTVLRRHHQDLAYGYLGRVKSPSLME